MIVCPHCGAENSPLAGETLKTCMACGKSLRREEPQAAPPPLPEKRPPVHRPSWQLFLPWALAAILAITNLWTCWLRATDYEECCRAVSEIVMHAYYRGAYRPGDWQYDHAQQCERTIQMMRELERLNSDWDD